MLKAGLIWSGLLLPLMLYGLGALRRPPREALSNQPLFQGIVYSRRVEARPHPQIVHILDIDLTAPGLKPFVTPGFKDAQPNTSSAFGQESLAQRTSRFLQVHRLQVAVNANYFYPFREETLWDYGPKEGEPANLLGLAISEGEVVSLPQQGWPALCFFPQRAEIHASGDCPQGVEQAVAGNQVLLQNGQPTASVQALLNRPESEKPYPINIAAIDASGARLWLILSDGKQPLYSEGTTLQEMLDLLQTLGATTAVKLDGGGSTTLAIATDTSSRVLNAVIHAKAPGQERPVGNHLGFFAEPVQP
ncbi:MAG: phosphodiester glycosidase family protein [Leptolyngbyaceae cyanobacterium MO_188.B28]|nr:phosphodiester glycosidase family protein [Leptolyngbyaceae cyanobacterium MO_188.B28]